MGMAGLALVIPVAFGGALAASATDLPPGDPTSLEVVAPAPEQETLPASGDTTTEQPTKQESAPAPAAPIVATPDPVEAAASAVTAPSVPVPAENTQPAPPGEQAVVDSKTSAPEALTTTTTTPPPPAEKCVTLDKSKLTHTFNEATGAVTIVAKGGKAGTPVCNPLYVNVVAYAYTAANSQWPQEPVNQVRIFVDKVGSFSGAPSFIKDCRQYDAYASYKGWEAVTPPPVLKGPGNPYEPEFLHQHSTGPTSHHASSAYGCAGKPEVPGPQVITSDKVEGKFVCGDEFVTSTYTITTTFYKVVFVDGKYKLVVDTDKSTVVTKSETRPLTTEEIESCKPEIPAPFVVVTEAIDGKFVCGDEFVNQTGSVTTTPYKAVLVSGSTWEIVLDTDNVTVKPFTSTRSLTAEEIESCKPEIPAPKVEKSESKDAAWKCNDTTTTQTHTVTTTPYKAVLVSGSTWETVLDTDNTTVKTEQTVRTLTAAEAYDCPVKASLPTPPQKLAMTGGDIAVPAMIGIGILLLGGTLALIAWNNRRRKATDL
jgi:hypothetical protein